MKGEHFSLRQVAGQCQHWDHHQKAARQHVERQGQVVPVGVTVKAAKGRAVIAGSGNVGIKDAEENP